MLALSRTQHRIADERLRSAETHRLSVALGVADLPPSSSRNSWHGAKVLSTFEILSLPPREVAPENVYMAPSPGVMAHGVDIEAVAEDWLFEDDRPWF